MQRTSVMWFRRDLRLADNPALVAAAEADRVLPLFVLDPELWEPAGEPRRAYLTASLRALREATGGALVVRRGDPVQEVRRAAAEVGARQVHVAADHNPYGRRRDDAVESVLATERIELVRTGSPYAVTPGSVETGSGSGYQVFSPFYRAWQEHRWPVPAGRPEVAWTDVPSEPIPAVSTDVALPDPGEEAALVRWRAFVEGRLGGYDDNRNLPGVAGTSQMSVHLKWGEIHPRTMLAELASKRSKGAATYRRELAWREFYADVLARRPETARGYYDVAMAKLGYDEPGDQLDAWKQGRTGFPLVDAGMRQLRAMGWMHNRVRMVVASFLVKDLHVEWQHGARHFMRHLVDGDLASNQHGWQWVAGSGTDPAPYFRVFNPVTQSRTFDPDGAYIRRWVPELAEVPAPEIHEPVAVDGYPAPIVNHAAERSEALRRYERVKGR